jgi:integrase
MSIMVNSAKTPTGKAKKGQVTVREDSGSIKACFPRNYFADGKQVKLGTGINPDDWEATATKLQRRLQLELEEGKLSTTEGIFNLGRYQEILEEYGLRAKLRVVKSAVTSDDQLPPKPELSLLEIWDMYCEYRRHDLKETTYETKYQGQYLDYLKSAIEATKSEDAIKIRNWLTANRSLQNVKKIISQLSNAYQLALRQKLITYNPYEGLANEITVKGARKKSEDEINTETDNDVLDKSKAYSWDEVQIILDYIKNNTKIKHWYSFVKFKFLTGCRTGEAIAFMWCDVLWDKRQILFRRTYDKYTRGFYPVKTVKGDQELIRIFPMPKDGELWNLLKSIPQGKPNEVVFKSRTGKTIIDNGFRQTWCGCPANGSKGIIAELINQGKLTKYLSPYNTRHTFITHQIFDLGRDEKIVSAWCGHGEMVSQKHYQDIADRAMQINPELPANQQTQQLSRLEFLEQQNKMLMEQLEELRKLIQEKKK